MKNKPLSDLKIKNAKIKEKDYQLGDQYGLYLLVKTTGNKLWQMRYTSPTTKRRNIVSPSDEIGDEDIYIWRYIRLGASN